VYALLEEKNQAANGSFCYLLLEFYNLKTSSKTRNCLFDARFLNRDMNIETYFSAGQWGRRCRYRGREWISVSYWHDSLILM
jgi:hypothetical protein